VLQTEFIVGQDNLNDIQVSPTPQENFYFFYKAKQQQLIKRFVLGPSTRR
jgi:hypothetical protein